MGINNNICFVLFNYLGIRYLNILTKTIFDKLFIYIFKIFFTTFNDYFILITHNLMTTELLIYFLRIRPESTYIRLKNTVVIFQEYI